MHYCPTMHSNKEFQLAKLLRKELIENYAHSTQPMFLAAHTIAFTNLHTSAKHFHPMKYCRPNHQWFQQLCSHNVCLSLS